jgi:hypothetical protein
LLRKFIFKLIVFLILPGILLYFFITKIDWLIGSLIGITYIDILILSKF